jgi:phosphatidylglycerophosphate synthase
MKESDALAPVAVVRLTSEEARGAVLRVAGLTVLERAVRQLRRMGRQVVIAVTGDAAHLVSAPGLAGQAPGLAGQAPDVRPVTSPEEIAGLVARLGPDARLVAANVVRPHNRNLDDGLVVVDESTRRAAEDAIFDELRRGDLGVVARHLNKPISFRITRYLLCRLPVTPNQVTLGAAVVGLAGAALVALGRPWSFVLGLFLAHVQSVLDGCDGELARVRFQQSAIGEWLDTIVDDGLNFCLVLALGVGLWRLQGERTYLFAGLIGAAMLLFYNTVTYRELLRQGEGGEVLNVRWWFTGGQAQKAVLGQRRRLASRLMGLGRRDFFIFAWFVLALLGMPRAVLVYACLLALGTFVVAVGQLLWRGLRRDAR